MPLRKACELVMALYGFGYGIFIWGYAVAGINVLFWTKFDINQTCLIGQLFVVCGLTHGFGTWLNGRWMLSPMIRSIGMIGHLTVMFSALINGTSNTGPSTALYAYTWIAGFYAIGLCASISDFIKNIREGRAIWMR